MSCRTTGANSANLMTLGKHVISSAVCEKSLQISLEINILRDFSFRFATFEMTCIPNLDILILVNCSINVVDFKVRVVIFYSVIVVVIKPPGGNASRWL